MDFVVGLPRSPRGKDAIWVVIDRLTKVAHFITMKTTNSASDLVPLYIKEVVRLHSALGTGLDLSTAFHPQIDGQSECTIQTLEDLL